MRLSHILGLSSILLITLSSCQTEDSAQAIPTLSWSFDTYDEADDRSSAAFTITGVENALKTKNWELYFNQLTMPDTLIGADVKIERVAGDLLRIVPGRSFKIDRSGSASFSGQYYGFAGRISYAPAGAYLVSNDKLIELQTEISWPAHADSYVRDLRESDNVERFSSNLIPNPEATYHLIPEPLEIELLGQVNLMRGRIAIGYPLELQNEAEHLGAMLSRAFDGELVFKADAADAHMLLELNSNIGSRSGSYELHVEDGIVRIIGRDEAGVFYGIQSLERFIDINDFRQPDNELKVTSVNIQDRPRFDYRGLHLDVSRNFHSLSHVKRVVDQMARFKLNKLHLTLTNDEGWRLEIPGLPELTAVGAKRGHTKDERDMILPAYGSGPKPGPQGSGFYSRSEFVELLKYANSRHVEIIPEVDLPGHARAAMLAMESRYYSLMDNGDGVAARQYLLTDLKDESQYNSAQNYNDNVVCVCMESVYDFVEKVVDELVAMYEDADVELAVIHCGGDEVPYGAWQKSPVCNEFISQTANLESADDLHAYFMRRFIDILGVHNIVAAGWEEIVLNTGEAGHNSTDINSEFLGQPVLPYVWNSVKGWGREDMAYRLANLGYEIVMCNSSAVYFDLAYNHDPLEPGLTWSGYVNTEAAFSFEPVDMFATATEDISGQQLTAGYLTGMTNLNHIGINNIEGIQGQLWSETIRNSNDIDYYLFPKLMGLAQRAWAPEATWIESSNIAVRLAGRKTEWARFRNTVGLVELPLLDVLNEPVKYRIPIPAARMRNDILEANVTYPGLQMRYTTDGSEPTINSKLLRTRSRLDTAGIITIRAFDSNGRGGRAFVLTKDSPSYRQ